LAGNGWNQVSWIYTYSGWNFDSSILAALDFVPMLYGCQDLEDFQNAFNVGAFDSSTCALGFFEPDTVTGANLSPKEAAYLWRLYIEPLTKKGLNLGAPSVSGTQSGLAWLDQFLDNCSDCTVDFIPLHWYGSSCSDFQSFVNGTFAQFGKNIWITEFACVSSPNANCTDIVSDFVTCTTAWLGNQYYVKRFSYFGSQRNLGNVVPIDNALLTADGSTNTALGIQFVQNLH